MFVSYIQLYWDDMNHLILKGVHNTYIHTMQQKTEQHKYHQTYTYIGAPLATPIPTYSPYYGSVHEKKHTM